jgi:hypothetical protein
MMLAFGLICLVLGGLVFLGSKSAIHEILAVLLGGVGLMLISLEVILHRLVSTLKDIKDVLRQIQSVLDATHGYHTNIDQNLARLVTTVERREAPPVISDGNQVGSQEPRLDED